MRDMPMLVDDRAAPEANPEYPAVYPNAAMNPHPKMHGIRVPAMARLVVKSHVSLYLVRTSSIRHISYSKDGFGKEYQYSKNGFSKKCQLQ
jgi:hypothetical protein